MRYPGPTAAWAHHIGYRLWLLTEPVISFWHLTRGDRRGLSDALGVPVHTRPHGTDLDGFVFPRMGSYVVAEMRCAKLAVLVQKLTLVPDTGRPTLEPDDNEAGVRAVYLGAMTKNKAIRVFFRTAMGDEEGEFV